MSVYFAQCGDDGPIKIGYATDAASRVRDLATASPFPLRLMGAIPGDYDDEMRWHRYFARLRLSGEWFRPDAALTDTIERALANPDSFQLVSPPPVVRPSIPVGADLGFFVKDAGAYLRLSERTVFNAIKKGRLASALVEGRRVIRVADAQAFMDAHYADADLLHRRAAS